MADAEKIRKEGIALIEGFSKKLESVPDTEETHYVVDTRNVTREDAPPIDKEGFQGKMKRIAPRWEDGYVAAEKGV